MWLHSFVARVLPCWLVCGESPFGASVMRWGVPAGLVGLCRGSCPSRLVGPLALPAAMDRVLRACACGWPRCCYGWLDLGSDRPHRRSGAALRAGCAAVAGGPSLLAGLARCRCGSGI